MLYFPNISITVLNWLIPKDSRCNDTNVFGDILLVALIPDFKKPEILSDLLLTVHTEPCGLVLDVTPNIP